MKIKGNEYNIDKNPPLGLLEKMDIIYREGAKSMSQIIDIIQKLLIPHPTLDEIRANMGIDEFYDIVFEFQKIQKEKAVDIKKKLSQ